MELGGEVIREPAVDLLPMDLPAQPGDLPGDLAMLSVLIVGRDVGDDLDTNRPVQGIGRHQFPPVPVDSAGANPIPSDRQPQ
jgi:hypothetical protein